MTADADIAIEDLVHGFEATTLDKSSWTHAAHVRTALFYVMRHGADEAAVRMREGIKRYNAAVGGPPTAYHETITLAWIAVVASFVAARPGRTHADLAREIVIACADKHHLLEYYTRDVLMSDEARARWVPPDVAAFGS